MSIAIAIDGPAAAGKSTIAKALAEKIGAKYLDTGSMYRAVCVFAVRSGIDVNDSEKVISALDSADVTVIYDERGQRTLLGGEDVTDILHDNEYSMLTSVVSAIPAVRDKLVAAQRVIAQKYSIVMDGRDIGTVVLPDADVKFFMTADVNVRAKRRYDELVKKGMEVDFDSVLADLKQRDYNDTHRAYTPLKKADDAIEVDTTYMTIEQARDAMFALAREKLGKEIIK